MRATAPSRQGLVLRAAAQALASTLGPLCVLCAGLGEGLGETQHWLHALCGLAQVMMSVTAHPKLGVPLRVRRRAGTEAAAAAAAAKAG